MKNQAEGELKKSIYQKATEEEMALDLSRQLNEFPLDWNSKRLEGSPLLFFLYTTRIVSGYSGRRNGEALEDIRNVISREKTDITIGREKETQ